MPAARRRHRRRAGGHPPRPRGRARQRRGPARGTLPGRLGAGPLAPGRGPRAGRPARGDLHDGRRRRYRRSPSDRAWRRTFGSVLEASAVRALYQLGRWDEAAERVDAALEAGPVGSGRVSLLADAGPAGRRPGPDRGGRGRACGGREPRRGDHPARRAALADRGRTSSTPSGKVMPAAALTRLAFLVTEPDAPGRGQPRHPADHAATPASPTCWRSARAPVPTSRSQNGPPARSPASPRWPRTSCSGHAPGPGSARPWPKSGPATWPWRAPSWTAAAVPTPRPACAAGRPRSSASGERPYLRAYAQWRLAEAQLARRDGRDAAAPDHRGRHGHRRDRCGAAPLLGELTGLAHRARLHLAVDVGRRGPSGGSDAGAAVRADRP